jgi:uncharacterized membrane protein
MEYFKGNTANLINYTFQSLLVTYLLLLLIEQIQKGFVTTYFNLNYLLIIVIIAGILSVFSEKEHHKETTSWKDYAYITILSLAGFIIIKFKTADLNYLSWIISIIAGILIYLLSILILEEDEEEKEKEFHWTKKNKLIVSGSILLALALITVALSFFMNYLEAARIVFGSVYVLFIPGFIISFIFFKKIDVLERIALSFALSIAIVPLTVFYLNLIGLKIGTLNVFLTILAIIIISTIILLIKKKYHSKAP